MKAEKEDVITKQKVEKYFNLTEEALKEVKKRFKMVFMGHSTDDLKAEEVAEEAGEAAQQT